MTEVLSAPNETTKPKKAPVTKEDFLYSHSRLTSTPEGRHIGARQDQEMAAIDTRYACEKDAVHCGTKEKLSIEHMITEAQTMLYASLGIDPKLERNSTLLQFTKGGIDTIIMDNIELVKGIIEHGVEQFLAIFQAMFSVNGIKRMLQETGQSFMDLFTGDAYATGKAFGTIGMGMFGMMKGAVKSEMKHILKETAGRKFHFPEDFHISRNLPPEAASSLIYEWVEKLSVENLRNWVIDIDKVLNLIQTSAEYIEHNLGEIKQRTLFEKRTLQWTMDAFNNSVGKILKDPQIPLQDRRALTQARGTYLQPIVEKPILNK